MPAIGLAVHRGPPDIALESASHGGYSKGGSRRLLGSISCADASGVGSGGMGDLEKAVRLFTHEDTVELAHRQLVVLNRVGKVCQRGFRYRELALVGQLLPLVERRIVSGNATEFRAPFLKLLKICALAPVRDRANEESTEAGLTASSGLFRLLGDMLWSTDLSIQSETANALRMIAAGNDPTRPNTPEDDAKATFAESLHDLRPKPRDTNQALLLGCGVVTSTVDCLGATIGSLFESLADLDDVSLESSSFGGSEGDFQAEAQLVYRGLEEQMMGKRSNEAAATASGLSPEELASTGPQDSEIGAFVDEPQVETQQPALQGNTLSDMAATYSVLACLLQFVRELSTNAASAPAMVEAGLVSLLVQALRAVRGIRDPILSVAVEILWNCLEHSQESMSYGSPAASRTDLIRKARKSNAAFALSTWDGVSALRDTLEALLVGGFRKKEKELRNEAVIVASLLSSNGRSHSIFRSTGMLQLLLRYATAIETGLADGDPQAAESEARTSALAADDCSTSRGTPPQSVPDLGELADPRNFATTTEVDLELKLLLWSLLAELSKRDPQNLEVIKASPLMGIMLMYMDLVVEEGPCSDAASTGLSRSVSLASMPSAGSSASQVTEAAVGNSKVTGLEAEMRLSSGVSGELGSAHSASVSGRRVSTIIKGTPTSSHPSESPTVADKKSPDTWERETSSPFAEGEVAPGERTVTGATQLYVPATLVRLPVTSIQLLQSQAMASLLVLAPRFPTKFQALGGHIVTLRFLDRLGSRRENQALVKAATKMLATVVGLPGLKEELGRMDAVRIMLERLSDDGKRGSQTCAGDIGGRGSSSSTSGGASGTGTADGSGGGNGEGSGDLRTDTVIILCRLCEDCHDNQEAFRKADGVPTMMAAIKSYCRARGETKQHEAGQVGAGGNSGGGRARNGGAGSGMPVVGLGGGEGSKGQGGSSGDGLDPALVHIVDCIWCAVVGNRRSEARFLQCEGLDTLLDLLELCPVVMRHQVTGVIADLLRNKRSIPYARAWRSDLNMLSISQLMVRLWVAEEARLGVSRPNGVLQNLWRPLQSHGRGIDRLKQKNSETSASQSSRLAPSSSDQYRSATNITSSNGNDSTTDAQCSALEDTALVAPSDSTVERAGTPPENTLLMVGADRGGNSDPTESRSSRGGLDTGGSACANNAILLALQAGRRDAGKCGDRGRNRNERKASKVDGAASVTKAIEQLDLRGKIAAVLGMVGFDVSVSEGLGPSDLKASYMAMSYLEFRIGEVWQEVAAELEAQHVNPIAADALVLDTMLERAFDRAHEVKSKQTALSAEQGLRDSETEEMFFASILFQRDQEIRQAIIKRNALIPGKAKKRLAAKKAKERTLKRSGDAPPSEGGSETGGMDTGLELSEEEG